MISQNNDSYLSPGDLWVAQPIGDVGGDGTAPGDWDSSRNVMSKSSYRVGGFLESFLYFAHICISGSSWMNGCRLLGSTNWIGVSLQPNVCRFFHFLVRDTFFAIHFSINMY